MNKLTFYKLLKSEKLSSSISDSFKSILTKKNDDYRLILSELDDTIYKIDGFNYLNRTNNSITFSRIFDSKINEAIPISGSTFERFQTISFTESDKNNITELIKETGGELTNVNNNSLPDLYLTKVSTIKNDDYFSEKTFKPFKISSPLKQDTNSFNIITSQLDLNNTNLSFEGKKINLSQKPGNTTTFGLTEYDSAIVGEEKTVILKDEKEYEIYCTFILNEGNEYNIYCYNDSLKEFEHISYFLFGISGAAICFEETKELLSGVKFTYEKSSKYGDQIKITCNNLITDGYEEKYNEINPEATNVS